MKALKPIKTFFSMSQPSNVLTVKEFKLFAEKVCSSKSWMTGVRYMVDRNGGALVLRADGSLEVYETAKRKVTYKPNSWGWEADRIED